MRSKRHGTYCCKTGAGTSSGRIPALRLCKLALIVCSNLLCVQRSGIVGRECGVIMGVFLTVLWYFL